MNNQQKKEWIIKYVKDNDLNDILSDKYSDKKKQRWFSRYSNEIQSICSLVSVFIISFLTIFIAFQSNYLLKKQNEIMTHEKRSIINAVIDDDPQNGTIQVSIIIMVFRY